MAEEQLHGNPSLDGVTTSKNPSVQAPHSKDDSHQLPPGKRGGRRPGGQSTKKKILDAAIDIFAENGYDKSSLRSITSRAGVDVALVKHFFGGKEGLFEAAVIRQAEASLELLTHAQQPGHDPSRRIAEIYVSIWEDDPTAATIRALFRAILESPQNKERLRAITTSYIEKALLPAFQETIASPSTLRTQTLAAELMGLGVARYILQFPPLSEASRDETVELIIPLIRLHLEQNMPHSREKSSDPRESSAMWSREH